MPTVKSKRRRPKREVHDAEEQGAGRRLASSGGECCSATLCSRFILSGSPAGALEVEMEEGTNRSPSRDPLTPEPQDPAPKKKKKKRAATIGNNLFMINMWKHCHVVL